MADPTTPRRPAPMTPVTPVSINDTIPTSSPSPKITLIWLACIVGIITLFVLYWNIIGF